MYKNQVNVVTILNAKMSHIALAVMSFSKLLTLNFLE